jgi:hypothetical protein
MGLCGIQKRDAGIGNRPPGVTGIAGPRGRAKCDRDKENRNRNRRSWECHVSRPGPGEASPAWRHHRGVFMVLPKRYANHLVRGHYLFLQS